MAQGNKPLPEGTDSVLDEDGIDETIDRPTELENDLADLDEEPAAQRENGASAGSSTSGDDGIGGAFFGKFEELRAQATDSVFSFAQTGKDRATGAIDDMVRLVEDAAAEIDAKVGTQYGDYARRAAQGLGGFSDVFKAKEIDELFADAKALAQKSPAVTIGAAAALGFVVARLVKAGIPGNSDDAPTT